MSITPIYAGILTLVFLALSFRVIGLRRSAKISLGDGESKVLQRRIRAHGNFAEYVPLALILMAILELQNAAPLLLHGIGILLMSGRAAHGFALSYVHGSARVVGMVLTFTALIAGALANFAFALSQTL